MKKMTLSWQLIIVSVFVVLPNTREYEQIDGFENLIQFTNKLEVHTGCCLSNNNCAELCCINPFCTSFFYNEYNGRCQLHSEIFTDNSTAYYNNGTRYYNCQKGDCPVGWYPFNGNCYLLGNYTVDWYGGSEICKQYGGSLVAINSRKENQFVINLFSKTRYEGVNHYWLDGTDTITEGVWRWNSTNEMVTYTFWSPGEPSNTINKRYPQGENYIGLGFGGIWWNDWPGNYSFDMSFLCEKQGSKGNCCNGI